MTQDVVSEETLAVQELLKIMRKVYLMDMGVPPTTLVIPVSHELSSLLMWQAKYVHNMEIDWGEFLYVK